MEPSVGRIVHYVSHGSPVRADGSQAYGSECRAAVVTALGRRPGSLNPPEEISLCILNPTGVFFTQGVEQDEEQQAGGTWHWPERAA